MKFAPAVQIPGGLGPIDGAYGLKIITTLVRAFFDDTLRGRHDSLLDSAPSLYPEVQIQRR